MALLAAAFSSLIFGVADFAGGYATRRTPVRLVVLFSQLVGLVAVVAFALVVSAQSVASRDLVWGGAAGVSGMIALLLFYEALAKGRMLVVSPLAAISGIGLPVVFGALIGERPSLIAAAGIALAVPAIALISTSATDQQDEPVLWRGGAVHGLAAGLGFGGFFILISRSADTSGMWPLVSARITTVAIVAVILLVSGAIQVPERTQLPIIAVAGVCDILANVFFVVAVRGSLLILASAIVSLYPVSTLILARFVLGERTSMPQRIGLALGTVAIVAITTG